MKKTLFFILILCCLKIKAQNSRKFLYADIKDEIGLVYNAHIINLTTKQGTFTNEDGGFRILAKANDSLKISFIGYKSIRIKVAKKHFGIKKTVFNLVKTTYELDEVSLKINHLSGSLTSDIKQTPEDISIKKSKSALDFSMIDFNKKVSSKIDEITRSKSPDILSETDPTLKFKGASAKYSTGKDRYAYEKRRMRKEIKFKEEFPKKLLSEFGESFFFEDLKIPREKYHNFLEYCNYLDIEQLYKDGKTLKMIKILQQEKTNYLKAINSTE